MPIRELKTDGKNQLIIQRLLHAKHYELTLNKDQCVSCEICRIICPREAIETKKQPKQQGQKVQRPIIDVNQQKCSYCGICETICPFDAIRIRVNNEHLVSVVEKESFPKLIHDIKIDAARCHIDCVECEKACPLNLIKVNLLDADGKQVSREDISSHIKNDLKVQVDIRKEQSPCCRLCEIRCPEGAIRVRKIFHGVLDIGTEKCPPNCQDCLDVCPIPSALFLDSAGKVRPNATFCVFCGTCKIVCPAEGALTMERRSISHTPIKSGAWNKAIEKLTSAKEYSKESQTKRAERVQQSIERKSLLRGVESV